MIFNRMPMMFSTYFVILLASLSVFNKALFVAGDCPQGETSADFLFIDLKRRNENY